MAQNQRFEDLPIALHLLYDILFFITKIFNGLIYIRRQHIAVAFKVYSKKYEIPWI